MFPNRSECLKIWAFALGALLSLGGCAKAEGANEEEQADTRTVRVEKIRRADITEVLAYVADLQPFADVKVFSPVPDRILDFPWRDGQTVSRGQRLALIRKEGLDKGLEQVTAQAEALDVQVRNLESELKRSEELLQAGVITRQTFDKLQTSYQAALAQRKAIEASKEQLAVTAGNAVITAPISGVVANRSLEVGDMAVPQIPLCRILQIDKLKALLGLVEEDVSKVHLGHEVFLHLDAYPKETFSGRITAILPYLEQGTRTNRVEVTLENPKDPKSGHFLLKPGMFGRAELVLGTREQALAGPEPAFLLDGRLLEEQAQGEMLRKAFIVDDEGVARERRVRLGVRKGSLYEILEGLAEGERVVVRGQYGLRDGQKVTIVEASQG